MATGSPTHSLGTAGGQRQAAVWARTLIHYSLEHRAAGHCSSLEAAPDRTNCVCLKAQGKMISGGKVLGVGKEMESMYWKVQSHMESQVEKLGCWGLISHCVVAWGLNSCTCSETATNSGTTGCVLRTVTWSSATYTDDSRWLCTIILLQRWDFTEVVLSRSICHRTKGLWVLQERTSASSTFAMLPGVTATVFGTVAFTHVAFKNKPAHVSNVPDANEKEGALEGFQSW